MMRPGVESGLALNYARIAESPKKKGCFDGYARDSLDVFNSGAPAVRSAQSMNKDKPKPETPSEGTKAIPETTSKKEASPETPSEETKAIPETSDEKNKNIKKESD